MDTSPTAPLRVAYLINRYPAGSHTFIRREIEALERQGVSVQRIALRKAEAQLVDADDCAEATRTRYVLAQGPVRLLMALVSAAARSPARLLKAARLALQMAHGSDRPVLVHLAYVVEACVVLDWARTHAATHLHAHFATNPAEIAMLVRALGGPTYSFTAHGSDIMDRPAQVGLALTTRDAKFVVAVCSFGRSQILKWVPHSLWRRVHVVGCGLQRGYGKDVPPPPATGAARVLCIGRLSSEKGQLLLVEAARLLAARGVPFEIVLVGDGPLRAEIEAMIDASSLRHCIRITGWLDATGIQHELALAKALVVSSLSEGLPVVIMEAMACGRPVAAPYLAGIPELVKPGRSGWLFPAGDTTAMADALEACLATDEAVLRAMGQAARTDVWASHDVDHEAQRLLELIRLPHE